MTTNPEQADTVPPLSDDELAFRSEMGRLKDALEEGAVVSLDEWAQIAVALGGRVEHLEWELRSIRKLLTEIDRNTERHVTELETALATARRQRDERPAGRVVARQVTDPVSSIDGPGVSRFHGGFVDEPPGTLVAVVVVADDSGTDS